MNRIILTRPAVEAGERLGFLPGDLQSKVDPYLRPLYDALFDMLGAETYQKYLERGNIEVAPLAYMRGRTLDDSFIILDEARRQDQRPEGGHEGAAGCGGRGHLQAHQGGRGAPRHGAAYHRGLREI